MIPAADVGVEAAGHQSAGRDRAAPPGPVDCVGIDNGHGARPRTNRDDTVSCRSEIRRYNSAYGAPNGDVYHELDGWPDLRWKHPQVSGRSPPAARTGASDSVSWTPSASRSATTRCCGHYRRGREEQRDRGRAARRRPGALVGGQALGLEVAAETPDRYVDGIVEMMLDATQQHDKPLTEERLVGWHAALFPDRAKRHAAVKTGGCGRTSLGPWRSCRGPSVASGCTSSRLRRSS